jgi:hypothetical protein
MHRFLFASLAMLAVAGILPLGAQPAPDISFTSESFNGLSVEQAARRLIGPSAQLVSKMIIGLPPGYPGAPLSLVRFFSRPRAVEPGLCQQNEIDVLLETADGSPAGSANASTPMKISGLRSGYGFAVVGDLTVPLNGQQRTSVEEKCGELDEPLAFFPAASAMQAWEAAYLVDVALTQARASGREQLHVTCNATKCDDAFDSILKLSPNDAFDIVIGCHRPPDGTSVCYSVRLSDPLNGYRSWLLYVESARRVGVGRGPSLTFRSATFTLKPEPVI